MIQSVLGPVRPAEFGVCLPHEHLWCDQLLAPRRELLGTRTGSGVFMQLLDFEAMVAELGAFREAGGGAVVEVTCDGWGRDLEVLARLSEASGVHIVATAGFYIEPCMPAYVAELSVEQLADRLTRELLEGVGPAHRRCGVLKSAIHRARVEGLERKALLAVAAAQRRTGVAITTHTTGRRRQEVKGGTVGVEQLEILKEEGVPASRLIVGHVDERPDVDILTGLAAQGCFIQFDVIGKEHWLLDQTRAELIGELIRRGQLEQLLLSHDVNREHELLRGGGGGYCHIFTSFLGRLEGVGVTPEEIRTMMVSNPARALTPAPV